MAGCNFLICVPGGDDVMLSYQSLSYHDALYLRTTLGRRAAPEFEDWMERMGMLEPGGRLRALTDPTSPLVRRMALESAR